MNACLFCSCLPLTCLMNGSFGTINMERSETTIDRNPFYRERKG